LKDVKVGDKLAGSWGYSMTLWFFGEVVKVTPKQVVVQEVQHSSLGGKPWEEKVVPMWDLPDKRQADGGLYRVKNDPDKDYVWIPKYRVLLYPYDTNKEYFENHMD